MSLHSLASWLNATLRKDLFNVVTHLWLIMGRYCAIRSIVSWNMQSALRNTLCFLATPMHFTTTLLIIAKAQLLIARNRNLIQYWPKPLRFSDWMPKAATNYFPYRLASVVYYKPIPHDMFISVSKHKLFFVNMTWYNHKKQMHRWCKLSLM